MLGALSLRDVAARLRGSLLGTAPVVFAVGLAAMIDLTITVEWSFPYCNDPQDGPVSAVFGMPLPYERWTGVTSLEYEFAPHLYILNLALLSLVVLLVLAGSGATRRVRRSKAAERAVAALGALLCVGVGAWRLSCASTGMWQPVSSIARPPYDHYAEYRPTGLASARHYSCTPSPFWFAAVWTPSEMVSTEGAE